MAANRYPIGVSSYDDGTPSSPHGKTQTVISDYLAQQLRSAAVEFDRDVLKNNGEHLTPNEGIRELDRQQDLYSLYLAGKGALAAYPGTSTHGPQIGTAVDFGVTRADGSNRALTADEWPKLYAILDARGIRHTGALFRVYEAWHCNGVYAAKLPPITNAPLMGTSHQDDKPAPPEDKDDIDMSIISLEWTDDKNPVARTAFGRWPIVTSTIPGSGYKNDRVETPTIVDLIVKLRSADPTEKYSVKYNGAQRNIVDFVFRQCQNQFRTDVATEVVSALKQQGVIK